MQITPIFEKDAEGTVKNTYDDLKKALQTHSLPVFFSYIGPFPEYLTYISEQLIQNLNNARFSVLIDDAFEQFKTVIQSELTDSSDKTKWLQKYSHSPSFYYFEKDLQHIFKTNIKLCLIFIALREAVKGWAVAAKQIKSNIGEEVKQSTQVNSSIATQIIFDVEELSNEVQISTTQQYNLPTEPGNQLAMADQSALERNLLPEYLQICRNDFGELLKQERVLLARVSIEKLLLSYIGLFPSLVFSPINVVLELTSKYDNFYELLYLLSEHFPTFAVQRMMFSGYMMK